MPDLLIDISTSVDGYAVADGWPGWWAPDDSTLSRRCTSNFGVGETLAYSAREE